MEQQDNGRFTPQEIALLKTNFKDNLPLLKAIRKTFLQMELTEKEDIAIKTTIKGDVHKLISRLFLPKLDGDAPIKEVLDLMMTIDLVARIPEDAKWHLRARKKLIDYLEERLSVLGGKKGFNETEIKFDTLIDLTDNDVEDYINVTMRNTILNHVETILEKISIVSNQEDITEEEQGNKDKANSNK